MLNKDLTREDALWLVNEYKPKSKGRVCGITMDKYFIPARSLMIGKPVSAPGCACQNKSYVMMTNSLYSQHEEEIKRIAAEPIKPKRGRKTKG